MSAAFLNLPQVDVLDTIDVHRHQREGGGITAVVGFASGINMHVRDAATARRLKEAFAKAERILTTPPEVQP